MTIKQQRVTCSSCSNVFEAELVVDAPISIVIASMKAVRCPKCGSRKCGLGGAYDDAPPLSAPVADRAGWWIERGEVGTSSRTIWSALTGTGYDDASVPYDPDDFRRCRLLLALIPEWRGELQTVADAFPMFAPFVSRWDEMDRLYDLESPAKICPKLYKLMQVAVKESRARF